MPFVLLANGAPFFADAEDMAAIASGKIPLSALWQGPLPQEFTGPGGNNVKPLTAGDFQGQTGGANAFGDFVTANAPDAAVTTQNARPGITAQPPQPIGPPVTQQIPPPRITAQPPQLIGPPATQQIGGNPVAGFTGGVITDPVLQSSLFQQLQTAFLDGTINAQQATRMLSQLGAPDPQTIIQRWSASSAGGTDPSGLDVGAELGGGPTAPPPQAIGPPATQQIPGGLTAETPIPLGRGGLNPVPSQPGVPVGEIATTGAGAGQADPQAQALRLITNQFNTGRFGNVDEVVAEIARVLGVDRNQALRFLEVIRPDFTRTLESTTQPAGTTGGVGATGGVPTPQVTPTPPPGPGEIGGGGDVGPQTRASLFAEQEGNELRRRLIADQFGANLSPLAGRAAGSALNRFTGLDPLLEFANPEQTLGQRFAGFAGGARPTGQSIGGQLDLLGGVGGGGPSQVFLDFVPDFQTAARLGAQETLAGVNPRLARRVESRFLDDFATRQAQRPEQFQTVDANTLAAQLQVTRDRFRGFF